MMQIYPIWVNKVDNSTDVVLASMAPVTLHVENTHEGKKDAIYANLFLPGLRCSLLVKNTNKGHLRCRETYAIRRTATFAKRTLYGDTAAVA